MLCTERRRGISEGSVDGEVAWEEGDEENMSERSLLVVVGTGGEEMVVEAISAENASSAWVVGIIDGRSRSMIGN